MELNFYKTPPGAYVEYYKERLTNVLIIYEGYEETKHKPSNDDYILYTTFQPYDIYFGVNPIRWKRKMNEDSWLAQGISDWEDVIQVSEEEAYRFMIRGCFEESGY